MISTSQFTHQLKRKKISMQRQQRLAQETDAALSEILTRRIELINILLAEFGDFKHPKSLANLLHRNKF